MNQIMKVKEMSDLEGISPGNWHMECINDEWYVKLDEDRDDEIEVL